MAANDMRFAALAKIAERPATTGSDVESLDEIWATDVFSLATMKRAVASKALSKHAYKAMKRCSATCEPLSPAVADEVAGAMKSWAIAKGAKFFSHIFYPLTGGSAEKHDGFIVTTSDGRALSEFSGKLLIKGEPDGSSFPNGGIRSTNAARGYTVWDPTSPAYVMTTANGTTLMIPSVFVSWTGESLDKKLPLLRSNAAMSAAATRVLSLMGETDIAPLNSSCGAEQEYFLVDAQFAASRPDLLLAGRTLFGAPSPKGQQFDDHYFGAIPDRVQVFMQDFEDKLYRLGIPAKTHHNEVAPGQFELAPYFEAANIAADHQQLMMTVMRDTAKEHGFLCLFHEKPFAGINGSGKHVNWSVGNSTQGNLLDPGDTPGTNLNFLLFCGAVIRGVHLYGPLLRAVIASAANDHRLGANEAPPAILSVYLGDQLETLFDNIKTGGTNPLPASGLMDLGLPQLLPFKRDSGDRNRTSPFAFTGNRFEFRAVGSSQSVADPLVAMNTMLADSLTWIADRLEAAFADGLDQPTAVSSVLQELMQLHGNAVFGGDGYSAEWHRAAVEDRGLRNLPTTAEALPVLNEPDVIALFERTGVLSPAELAARYEVYAEQYILAVTVEAKLVVEMAKTMLYPAALAYSSQLASTMRDVSALGIVLNNSAVRILADQINGLVAAVNDLENGLTWHDFDSTDAHMEFCAHTLRRLMDAVRLHADALEGEVADSYWPLPKYREMLFLK